MSTRSRIVMKTQKEYLGIYCHSDGQPWWVGKILLKYYSAPKKLKELLALGDLSLLDEEIGEKHDFNDTAHGKWCRAYKRDRGGSEVDSLASKTFSEQATEAVAGDAEYLYLWTDGWFFCEVDATIPPTEQDLKPLTVLDVLRLASVPLIPETHPLIVADWLEENDRLADATKIREFLQT